MDEPSETTDDWISRRAIRDVVQAALEPHGWALAMWEGGSASFGRADEWSDIDLMVVVDDDAVERAFEAVDEALAKLSPIEIRHRVPEPTSHGHAQVFYRLRDAGPYRLVDLAAMKRSSGNLFLEPALHGEAIVLFDKAELVRPGDVDAEALTDRLEGRVATLAETVDLFGPMARKELERGRPLPALGFYQAFLLRPLVELVRIRHDPARHRFGTRYLAHDVPADVASRLERLHFVADADALSRGIDETVAWIEELVDTTDVAAAVDRALGTSMPAGNSRDQGAANPG